MRMKIYQANEELKTILIQHGFKDTTSCRDKKKGKSAFKQDRKSKKEIYFDYINIQVLDRYTGQDSRDILTERELKSIILFFKLDRPDFKLIHPQGYFNFIQVQTRLIEIENELRVLTEKDIRFRRRVNLNRILKTFANIKLE